ncbi:MAG: hypothetical protein GKS03_10510 [Alphaproteobacteria bacterium]|nr:hypothetical protein [Alphaproteobacteria bacterium]
MSHVTDTLNPCLRPARERINYVATPSAITTLLFVLFLSFLAGSAQADVAGSVCVENGGVISVNGKRSEGRCIDGTMVRLYGVLAPSLDRECRIAGGEEWRCGLASAAALLQAVKGRQVDCKGNSKDREGQLMAICFIAGRSLNQFMVEMGWAGADRPVTSMFNEIEAQAQTAKRGLWSSDFTPEIDE